MSGGWRNEAGFHLWRIPGRVDSVDDVDQIADNIDDRLAILECLAKDGKPADVREVQEVIEALTWERHLREKTCQKSR